MKIKPKLYLNGSPQTAEEGSLAFARNMKVDNDGNLISDYGYTNISSLKNYNIVGHIVGLDNKIYLFTVNKIIEYDEINETVNNINSGWKYNGGEISGYVSTNISGEKILTIGEYREGIDIPLKHINLSYCKSTDDESIYCQAPICPTANLILNNTYVKTIPNGVYIFFIRYKIKKDVYTNWYVCSRPIYGGTSEKISTFQGGLQYINLHKDSAKSFIFDLNFAQEENKSSYKEFQLGFIINHDGATDARSWKHFDINTRIIYFDYENVKEINIDDLLKTTYELYNVKNITAFKNKLYISNYKETNFNNNINLENVIDLKVIDNYDKQNSDIPTAILSGYELKYNTANNIFDKTIDGSSIRWILQKDQFNYNVTNLIANGNKIADDKFVASFVLEWNTSAEPDIAFITKVTNNLHNNCIFGKAFEYTYPSGDINSIANTFGIDYFLSVTSQTHPTNSRHFYRLYKPVDTSDSYSEKNNSLYPLGFSFAFGSLYEANSEGYLEEDQAFNYYNYNYSTNKILPYHEWYSQNLGFSDNVINSIKDNIKKEIEDRSFFAKAYIIITSGANVYKIGYKDIMDSSVYAGTSMRFNADFDYKTNPYKYYVDSNLVLLNPNYFNTLSLNSDLKNNIIEWVFDSIFTRIKGIKIIGENKHIVLDLSHNGGTADTIVDTIQIVFKKIDFKVEIEENNKTDDRFKYTFNINMTSQDYISNCQFSFNEALVINAKNITYSQVPSLMPFSTYRTYIHLVDNHNIITNGIKLKDIKTEGLKDKSSILSLQYNLTSNISNYKSFFISIKNIGNIIIEGFGYKKLGNTHILNFLELDTLLYNINDNITIIDNTGKIITETAKYYSSGSSTPSLAFGNCGYVSWTDDENEHTSKLLYIQILRDTNTINETNLIKASGYIPLDITNEYINIIDPYYGSWFCSVTKPDFYLSSSCYISGKDIYTADRSKSYVSLKEFENFISISPSNIYKIRSNFNLNYLSLTEDINDSIFSIGSASSGNKQVVKVINSAILSYIYELKFMYKDFMNKTFNAYDEDYKIQFDNTIRVSNVLSDETFNNSVFKFDATDYYNIPTDRGIIVSLFAIGNTIYAHTKGSLYKFDATQTISATDKDIKLQEAEPFEMGLSQVFDSQHGYGGIENKEAGCITFDSYFFYDNRSNHIFAYSGNNQIQLIDGSIYKFLTYFKPKNCRTIHDAANNRIIFELYTNNKINFAISYNYKSKSFVSFHDITLEKTFSTRTNSYSYLNKFCILFSGDFIISNKLNSYITTYSIYGNASKVCEVSSDIYAIDFPYIAYKQDTPFVLAIITFPKQYFIEVINSISYLSYEFKDIYEYCSVKNSDDSIKYSWYNLINTKLENKNPINKLYIETDTCVSTPITSTIDDSERPNSLLDYKGFKYDKGLWTANYFRNTINKDNIYNYPDQPRNNQIPNSDNHSLVYGRFFILNFELSMKFPVKFEEIFINTEKY